MPDAGVCHDDRDPSAPAGLQWMRSVPPSGIA